MRSSEQLPEQTLLEGRCGFEQSLVVESEIQEFLGLEVGIKSELEPGVGVLFSRFVDEGVRCSVEGA